MFKEEFICFAKIVGQKWGKVQDFAQDVGMTELDKCNKSDK